MKKTSPPEAPARPYIADSYLGLMPRGLSRTEAARHIGIGVTKFDELVQNKQMPAPKRIGNRKIWDRLAVEAAFEQLPDDGDDSNPWDDIHG